MPFQGVHTLLRVTCRHQCQRFVAGNYKPVTFSLTKQTRMLGKLLAESAAERKQWSKGLPSGKMMTPKALPPKRAETLSRIFLATVTDGLTTSTRALELAEHGLLINRIKLSSCGRSIHVFWLSGSLESDAVVDEILKDCMDELRSNIVQRSIAGFVPHIVFEKDAAACLARDVENILNLPRVRQDIETKLPSDQSENAPEKAEAVTFAGVITTNILGLKRSDILRRVKPLIKTSNTNVESTEREVTEIPERLANIDPRHQKSVISAYMSKQMRADRKRLMERFAFGERNSPMSAYYDELESNENVDQEGREEYDDEFEANDNFYKEDAEDYYEEDYDDNHYKSADSKN